MFLFILMRSPNYFAVLFSDPRLAFLGYNIPYGVLMLLGALCWQLLGGYLIYKIVSIKV